MSNVIYIMSGIERLTLQNKFRNLDLTSLIKEISLYHWNIEKHALNRSMNLYGQCLFEEAIRLAISQEVTDLSKRYLDILYREYNPVA